MRTKDGTSVSSSSSSLATNGGGGGDSGVSLLKLKTTRRAKRRHQVAVYMKDQVFLGRATANSGQTRWILHRMLSDNSNTFVYLTRLHVPRQPTTTASLQSPLNCDAVLKFYIGDNLGPSHWYDLAFLRQLSTREKAEQYRELTALTHYPVISLIDYNYNCFVPNNLDLRTQAKISFPEAEANATYKAAERTTVSRLGSDISSATAAKKRLWYWDCRNQTRLCFYVMPRYQKTLRDVLEVHKGQRQRRLLVGAMRELVNVFYYMAELMRFMHTATHHSKAIVYLDLKPENIVFDSIRKPMLIDYGLAGYDLDFVGNRRELTRNVHNNTVGDSTDYLGTLKFCSLAAHEKRWSIAGDYETLLYNVVHWFSPGKSLPWSNKSIQETAKLKRNCVNNKFRCILQSIANQPELAHVSQGIYTLGKIVYDMHACDNRFMRFVYGTEEQKQQLNEDEEQPTPKQAAAAAADSPEWPTESLAFQPADDNSKRTYSTEDSSNEESTDRSQTLSSQDTDTSNERSEKYESTSASSEASATSESSSSATSAASSTDWVAGDYSSEQPTSAVPETSEQGQKYKQQEKRYYELIRLGLLFQQTLSSLLINV